MPAVMSKRERVDKTLSGQETDRVPLYDLLRNDAAFAHFSGEALPPLAGDEAGATHFLQQWTRRMQEQARTIDLENLLAMYQVAHEGR